MHYHRADSRRRMPFFKHPGKYGLFLVRKRQDGTVPVPAPEDMVSSADAVDVLIHERLFFDPAPRLLAVILKAERIPIFDEAQT